MANSNAKRRAREDDNTSPAKRENIQGQNTADSAMNIETEDNLMFEDPFGDEMIEEEIVQDAEATEEAASADMMDTEVESEPKPAAVWRPGVDPIQKDEVLDYDESAYDLYHAMTAEWPSLSLDILRDDLGACRTRFPMTVYVAAGTQAARPQDNQLTIMKMSELHKTKASNDSDDESDDEMEGDPVLESRSIEHYGGVNRVRAMPQSSNIVATWADTGNVHLWDVSKQLSSLQGRSVPGISSKAPPVYTFKGHPEEGFAMDWSPTQQGHFLTGDCKKYIYKWTPTESSWDVDKMPYTGHKGSVEDLQWSPSEATVFASCSTDQTVRIWDTRQKAKSMLDVHAHEDDVNVISWNRNVAYLMVSGSDDGSFKIWDLRNFKQGSPVAHFRYHTAPITSVEWHPSDESVLAVSGADNQISIWDMSVEADEQASAPSSASNTRPVDVPPQLLFIHQGQTDIKELHFHPQCPGVVVSTAGDGFNVFKPANIS